MGEYKSEFLQVLDARGFIYQGTDLNGLDKKLCEGIQTGYIHSEASLKQGYSIPIITINASLQLCIIYPNQKITTILSLYMKFSPLIHLSCQ